MLLAMTIAALFCVGVGCFPQQLYSLLPYQIEYSAYDVSHVLAQLQLLAFSALAFTWLKLAHIYPPELKSTNLDAEWLYRRLLPDFVFKVGGMISCIDQHIRNRISKLLTSLLDLLSQHHGSHGILARTWPTGSMVLWVAILLGLTLTLYYF